MDSARWERYAPLTGAAFVLFFIAGMLLVDNYDYLPAGAEIQDFYESGSSRIVAGAYVALIGVFFFLWFAGSIRDAMAAAEGGSGRLSNVAFGGCIAAGAGMIGAFGLMLAAASRAGTSEGISIETATGLFDASGALVGSAVPFAFAALIGSAAVLSFRVRLFPGWLAWPSAILAVGLLTPAGYIFLAFAALWVLIVSILLFRSQGDPTATA